MRSTTAPLIFVVSKQDTMKKLLFILLTAGTLSVRAQNPTSAMEQQKPYTVLVLMNATPQWLSLSRDQRSRFFEKEVMPAFQQVGKTTTLRLFDSEYFHAGVSDFMMIETRNLDDYQELIERFRDSKIYGVPYFEIKDIIVGQENRFEDFNAQFKKEGK